MELPKKTPLYHNHQSLHAHMVNFAGWEMPLHYGSQLEEHRQVRQDAGIFDVSHMGVIDILGKDAQVFLEYLLANDIRKLKTPGRALYTCMLLDSGGVLDDLIVYFIEDQFYRLVVNAATTEKDLKWIIKQAEHFAVEVHHISLALLAIQGPNARIKTSRAFPQFKEKIEGLKPFHFFIVKNPELWLIARTGYTGEDGLEIILPQSEATNCFESLLQVGVSPIGLGARDTLRLEAGLNLYGQDMDESVSPLESNLAWTVGMSPDRDFIGKQALLKQEAEAIKQKLVGVLLLEKGVLRPSQVVFVEDKPVGKMTSGSFSPSLKQSIGLARIMVNSENRKESDECYVDIRGQKLKAKIVTPPFVRRNS